MATSAFFYFCSEINVDRNLWLLKESDLHVKGAAFTHVFEMNRINYVLRFSI